MSLARIGLLPRLFAAIAVGVAVGFAAPDCAMRALNCFRDSFGQFVKFFVPFIVIGLVTPAIADTGRAAGRSLVHGNAAGLLALHQWGARQLSARGFTFRMRLAEADAAAHPALAAALDRMPQPLTGPEEA